MNWFTTHFIAKRDLKYKKEAIAEDMACVHVKKNPELAHSQHMENDSCGPVSSMVVCKECHEKAQAAALIAPTRCDDCGKDVPFKDGEKYRGYGFDRRQGDEEKFICNVCRTLTKHQSRLAEDRRNATLDAQYDRDDDDYPDHPDDD